MVAAKQLQTSHLPELTNLTPSETEAILRFNAQPTGPTFFAASEIYRRRGDLESSILILELGLESYPSYVSARFMLAKDYVTLRRFNMAQSQLECVLTRQPSHISAWRLKLKLLALTGDFHNIPATLSMLGKFAPDDYFTRKIRVHAAMGEWSSVEKAAKMEISADLGVAPAAEPAPTLVPAAKPAPVDAPAPTPALAPAPAAAPVAIQAAQIESEEVTKLHQEPESQFSQEKSTQLVVTEIAQVVRNYPLFEKLQPFRTAGIRDADTRNNLTLTIATPSPEEKIDKKEKRLQKLRQILERLEKQH